MLTLFNSTAIDGTPSVPAVTVLCMATAVIMMIVVPIFIIRYIKKTYHASLKSLIYGIGLYLVFDLIVFNVVMVAWTNIKTIGGNELFIAILASVISGLAGVVGRTITIRALAGSKTVEDGGSFGNAYMSGVGYALLNVPVMLFSMLMNLLMSLMINLFGVSYVADEVGEDGVDALATTYEVFLTTPAYDFLISGVKIVLLIVASMSLSVVIYAVYKKKAHSVFLLFAALLSVLSVLPVYFNQYGILFKTSVSMILVMALFTGWMAFLAYGIMRSGLKGEIQELKEREKSVKQKAFPDFNKNIKKEI